MAASQGGGRPLEDRLRSLILQSGEATSSGPSPNGSPKPHEAGTQPVVGPAGPGEVRPDGSPPLQHPTGGRNTRKRLNQAQRRQMSAQLTIPIDPRASERQRASGSGFSHRNPGRPQSIGSRGSFQDPMSPASSLQSSPFLQQQQSPGSLGPRTVVSPVSQYQLQQDWRLLNSSNTPHPSAVEVGQMSPDKFASRPSRNSQRALYNSNGYRQYSIRPEDLAAQCNFLEQLCCGVITGAEIEHREIVEKETFRAYVEERCRAAIAHQEIEVNGNSWFQPSSVQLKCFGSLASGFATKAADMDLGLLSPASIVRPDAYDSPIPRLLEKALLDAGFGARLLTKTRVPIIKLCEKPSEQLRHNLLEERARFDQGITDEDLDTNEDDAGGADDDTGKAAAETTATVGDSDGARPARSPEQQPDLADRELQARQPFLLKQSDTQSLSNYYGAATGTLRRLKARDITHSNAAAFTESDFRLLDSISEAFVSGLLDGALKNRVQSCHSFSAGDQGPNYRSLQGVFHIVEGERLSMLWESRHPSEGDAHQEQSSAQIIEGWRNLQAHRAFGADPLSFNKELFLAVERLRQIPYVQFIELQQDLYESPADYYKRTVKIAARLHVFNLNISSAGRLLPAAV
jgi:terminal uridylyltransferase